MEGGVKKTTPPAAHTGLPAVISNNPTGIAAELAGVI